MRIIKRAALVRFWSPHPDAKGNLEAWHGVVREPNETTPIEMKQVYGILDEMVRTANGSSISPATRYRLMARVELPYSQTVFVVHMLRHSDYDKGAWKL